MSKYINFEPVRTLAAVLALGEAVLALFALLQEWSEPVIVATGGVWAALVAVVASVFVRSKVSPVERPEA